MKNCHAHRNQEKYTERNVWVKLNDMSCKEHDVATCHFEMIDNNTQVSETHMPSNDDSTKWCSKFTGEHPCWSVTSIKLQSKFIEITLRHGYSPVSFLYIFRTLLPKSTSGELLLFAESGLLGVCFSETWVFVKLLCNVIEITLRHGCSSLNVLHIFRTPLPKITYRGLLLYRMK